MQSVTNMHTITRNTTRIGQIVASVPVKLLSSLDTLHSLCCHFSYFIRSSSQIPRIFTVWAKRSFSFSIKYTSVTFNLICCFACFKRFYSPSLFWFYCTLVAIYFVYFQFWCSAISWFCQYICTFVGKQFCAQCQYFRVHFFFLFKYSQNRNGGDYIGTRFSLYTQSRFMSFFP